MQGIALRVTIAILYSLSSSAVLLLGLNRLLLLVAL